jgi:hypothetical protein
VSVPQPNAAPSIRQLVLLSVPALLIGVLSAVVLWALDEVAELVQHALWEVMPSALGVPAGSRWWIFVILTLVRTPPRPSW